jgi:hypothetical protein
MKDPEYRKAFDEAVKNVDVAQSTKKAVRERNSIDRNKSIKRTIRKTGQVMAVVTPILATTYYASHKQQVDNFMNKAMKNADRALTRTFNKTNMNKVKKFLGNVF